MVVKPDWRKEQEDPNWLRTQYVIYNQQRKHWTQRTSVFILTGSIQRFQVFLNHEKQWRTFSFNLNRELKMKYGTRLIRIIIQVVTVAFILKSNNECFLFLEEWNQVGQSGPALNNILMLLQNNSYFTYDLPLPFIMRNQFS
ncbi:Hypothetical_protein [Hexamita inflata]|uniref:Hypothetical_protein n=1 Tax=Hexamita inflata TaxID=28002 RepID=A0ABP1H6H3_9EUKA